MKSNTTSVNGSRTWRGLAAAAVGILVVANPASAAGKDRGPNLLFIMTDQQRWDALSIAGNTILKTPNLDRIGREGAYFELCNSQCPVCGPARSSLMTGRTVENSRVRTNMDADLPDRTPMQSYNEYLNKHVKGVKLWRNPEMAHSGMQEQTFDHRPYKTNPLDTRHGMRPGIKTDKKGEKLIVRQPDQHGVSTVPAAHTITAFQAKQTIEALERLAKQDQPFSLHCSFHCPHSPITPSEPFASMYDPKDMPVPTSIGDPMDNSPYFHENGRSKMPQYADPEKIRFMIANYYAFVKEIDVWVGRILDKVDDLGLADNTLIIFTSDHGEMLGAHGMREKNVFYEESVHVPLMVRFPGRIKPGTVVDEPVAQIDLYATILDYLKAGRHESDGDSLRRYIDGTATGEACAVSEWNWRGPIQPNLMVRTKRWKFFCPNKADSKVMNVLYDLENDPHEMNNLLGKNPDAKKHAEQGRKMKALLVEWLEKVDSPHVEEVKKRKIR